MSCGSCSEKTKAGAASATGAPVATGAAMRKQPDEGVVGACPAGEAKHCPQCGAFVDGNDICKNPKCHQSTEDAEKLATQIAADLQRVRTESADDAAGKVAATEALKAMCRSASTRNFESALKERLRVGDLNTAYAGLVSMANLQDVPPDSLLQLVRTSLGDDWRGMPSIGLVESLLKNPDTPEAVLDEMAKWFVWRPEVNHRASDIDAFLDHPHSSKTVQSVLAESPQHDHRLAAAKHPQADTNVLQSLAKDNCVDIASAAMTHPNSAYAATLKDVHEKTGLGEGEAVALLRHRKFHAWQALPRCGVCGAWTGQSGVCNNARCGAHGQVTARQRNWPPYDRMGLLSEVTASPYIAQAIPETIEKTQQAWNTARQSVIAKGVPDDMRSLLQDTVVRLSGHKGIAVLDKHSLEWDAASSSFRLDGIPVSARDEGEAARVALALLSQAGYGVCPECGKLGQGGAAACKGHHPQPLTGKPLALSAHKAGQAVPKYWQTEPPKGGQVAVQRRSGGVDAVLHYKGSPGFAHMDNRDNWSLTGEQLAGRIKQLEPLVGDEARPLLHNIHALSASDAREKLGEVGLDLGRGAWVATNSFAMVAVSADAPIPYTASVHPDTAKFIKSMKPESVTVGRNGGTVFPQSGCQVEIGGYDEPGQFPYARDILKPYSGDCASFRMTATPKVVKANDKAFIVFQGSDVFLEGSGIERQKIGETDVGQPNGKVAAVNPVYLASIGNAQPDGKWDVDVPVREGGKPRMSPLHFRHESGKAVAALMPLYLEK
jgi:hypothetical protein